MSQDASKILTKSLADAVNEGFRVGYKSGAVSMVNIIRGLMTEDLVFSREYIEKVFTKAVNSVSNADISNINLVEETNEHIQNSERCSKD